MTKRINAIMKTECKALGWKIDKTKSAQDNLKNLLLPLKEIILDLKERKSPPEEYIKFREKLKSATEELGQTITSLELLASKITNKKAKKLSDLLEKKSKQEVLLAFLRLATGQEKIRAKSHSYQDAWPDLEADYMIKLSITFVELSKRD